MTKIKSKYLYIITCFIIALYIFALVLVIKGVNETYYEFKLYYYDNLTKYISSEGALEVEFNRKYLFTNDELRFGDDSQPTDFNLQFVGKSCSLLFNEDNIIGVGDTNLNLYYTLSKEKLGESDYYKIIIYPFENENLEGYSITGETITNYEIMDDYLIATCGYSQRNSVTIRNSVGSAKILGFQLISE